MKYKIEYIKKKIKGGWIGMNKYAAKEHDIPYKHKHPAHTILVYKKVPRTVRLHTIHHEQAEEYLMKNLGMHYHPAHELALRYENIEKPFSIKELKKILKRRRKK